MAVLVSEKQERHKQAFFKWFGSFLVEQGPEQGNAEPIPAKPYFLFVLK